MLSKEEKQAIAEEVGSQAAEKVKSVVADGEKKLNDLAAKFNEGKLDKSDLDAAKAEIMSSINDKIAEVTEIQKAQGNKINTIVEKAAPNSISFEDFIEKEMKELHGTGKFKEFTGAQLKAAGVQSIAGSIPTPSPYAPGPGNILDIFGYMYNPNFITTRVNLGRTNQARLAWANELTPVQGAPALVSEGAQKPQMQIQFSVETSVAKKIAAYAVFTEEFEDDLPGFATFARRRILEEVGRVWDNTIQSDVIAVSPQFNVPGLVGQIQNANWWDALLAMFAQPGINNFNANTVAINYITDTILETQKNVNDSYLLPPFAGRLMQNMVFANKLADGKALVGDLQQYNVDIYKDFILKVGLINDDFIRNQETVVGEVRYHSYISDNRKKALVYDSLERVSNLIKGNTHSIG